MFSTVYTESIERTRHCALIYNQIKELEEDSDHSLDPYTKILKGLFFVSLYGSLEYTLISCSIQFLTFLQSTGKKPLDYNPYLLCVLLDPEFNAIRNSGNKTIWQKKANLIDGIFLGTPPNIDNTVFPTNGMNIGYDQLKDIWHFLHLPEPVIPEGINFWIIDEVKENRNAIAHGRITAVEVGQRYSVSEIEKKLFAIDSVCMHILNQFSYHVENETYLKQTA